MVVRRDGAHGGDGGDCHGDDHDGGAYVCASFASCVSCASWASPAFHVYLASRSYPASLCSQSFSDL